MMIRRGFFLCLLGMLLIASCSCFDKRVVVKSLVLEIPKPGGKRQKGLDYEKFAVVMEEAIKHSKYFRYDAGNEHGAIIKFSLYPPEEDHKAKSLLLMAVLQKNSHDDEYRAFADIAVEQGITSGSFVQDGINKALYNLYLIQRGSRAQNQDYIRLIESYLAGNAIDQASLVTAILVLGETQEKAGLGPMIALIQATNDLVIGNACLVALAKLKDPQAMPAIIEFVERKPPLIRRQGVMAAKQIASKLAAEWLLVMAYGYDDPVVREEALEALAYVEEKLKLVTP